jgi:opacity protein-like surface antigen
VRFALVMLAAATLFAAERSGPYLGAGMGIGTYDDGGRLAHVDSRNVPQYRVSAGAFINKHLSVALDYGQFEAFEGRTEGGEDAAQHFKMFTADVTGHYPVSNDRVDLYAKFGAGQIFWDETGASGRSSNAGTLVYGVGVGLRPWQRLTFNLGYDFYQFGMDDSTGSYNMSLGSAYLEFQVQF